MNQRGSRASLSRSIDALTAVRELFHISFWLARTYARGAKPADGLAFNSTALTKSAAVSPQTQEQLQQLAKQLAESQTRLRDLLADKATLSEQLEKARTTALNAAGARRRSGRASRSLVEGWANSLIDRLLTPRASPAFAVRLRHPRVQRSCRPSDLVAAL